MIGIQSAMENKDTVRDGHAYYGKLCGKIERPLMGLPSRKFKWQEYLMTRSDQEWKVRRERWHCPFKGEVQACIIIFFSGWGNCDSEIQSIAANFKWWFKFCLEFRLSDYTSAPLALIDFHFAVVLFFPICTFSSYWDDCKLCLSVIGNVLLCLKWKWALYIGKCFVFFQLEI